MEQLVSEGIQVPEKGSPHQPPYSKWDVIQQVMGLGSTGVRDLRSGSFAGPEFPSWFCHLDKSNPGQVLQPLSPELELLRIKCQ
jgi:hypothetical protein